MDFAFSEEQLLLREGLARYLRDNHSFDVRRANASGERGRGSEIWRAFAKDLGVLGAGFPEAAGGAGGGAVETMVIMEELGSALVTEPYLETVVVAGGLLRQVGGPIALEALRRIIAGELVIAFGWAEPGARYGFSHVTTTARREAAGWRIDGRKVVVSAAPWASQLIVSARTSGKASEPEGVSLFLLDADKPGVGLSEYPTLDGRRAADLVLDNVVAPAEALLGEEGRSLALIERAGDEAIAALSAEAVGVLKRLLRDTVDYAQNRRQFGRPVSAFQALQHRMVDMYLQVELAASACLLATLSLDGPPAECAKAASAAKATISNACRFVGQSAIQLHGGMGMTDELPVSHYFKRATVIENEFGSADHHIARFARLTG